MKALPEIKEQKITRSAVKVCRVFFALWGRCGRSIDMMRQVEN